MRTEPGLSQSASLKRLKDAGLAPATVFDVGVATGTPELYDVFENVRYALIEPLEESWPFMQSLVARYPGSVAVQAAAGPRSGEANLVVSRNLSGSSLLLPPKNGAERSVPMVTLDEVAEHHRLQGPHLVKLDVQGYELEVLSGAEAVLGRTTALIAEVSLWADRKGKGLVEFSTLVAWLRERDFVLFDIAQIVRREADDAITEMDLVFLPAASPLRENTSYKLPGQGEATAAKRRVKFGLG